MMVDRVETNKRGQPYKKDVVDKIIKLRRQGLSYSSIRHLTGVSRATIADYCQSAGLGGVLGYKPLVGTQASMNRDFTY